MERKCILPKCHFFYYYFVHFGWGSKSTQFFRKWSHKLIKNRDETETPVCIFYFINSNMKKRDCCNNNTEYYIDRKSVEYRKKGLTSGLIPVWAPDMALKGHESYGTREYTPATAAPTPLSTFPMNPGGLWSPHEVALVDLNIKK